MPLLAMVISDGQHPYVVHLDAVAAIIEDNIACVATPYRDSAKHVAYLHDVVEDTDTSLADINSEFGTLVASCVSILTDEPGDNRQQRKAKTYAKMALVDGEQELALLVKAADRLANVRACVLSGNQRLSQIYKNEHPIFKQAAYRNNLCDSIWQELDALVATI